MIDWQRLAELREEVGADDFQEVVDLFLEEVDEVIAKLREAPDPASFEQDLHFLKGSALNLGFQRFSVLCQAGEQLAAQNRTEEVDIAGVLQSYDASRSAFIDGAPEHLSAA